MGSLGWAIALSVLSAASYAAAAVAQERLAARGHRGLSRWAGALLLTGGGVGLHVLALNFGTVAVVQALGTLTLLFALPISRWRYKRQIGATAWRDALLTVAGLALIMSLSLESEAAVTLSPTAGRYLTLITAAVVAVLAAGASLGGPRVRAVLLATAAGAAFGISSVLSKAAMAGFTDGGLGAVSINLGLAIAMLSTSGYLLSQFSYRGAGLAAPLAAVSVANPVVAAIAGVAVFGETFRFGAAGQAMVGLAAVVMTLGVIGLARRTAAPTTPTDPGRDGAVSAEPVRPVPADPEPASAPAQRRGPRNRTVPAAAAEVGAGQVSAAQVSAGQVGAGQVGAGQVGAGQVGAARVSAGPFGTAQRAVARIGAARGGAVPKAARRTGSRATAREGEIGTRRVVMPPYSPRAGHEATVAADRRSDATSTPAA